MAGCRKPCFLKSICHGINTAETIGICQILIILNPFDICNQHESLIFRCQLNFYGTWRIQKFQGQFPDGICIEFEQNLLVHVYHLIAIMGQNSPN